MSTERYAEAAVVPPHGAYPGVKRATDVAGASIGLVGLAPLLVALGLVIALGSRTAPLFRQRRVGRGGREFMMWKFRTMAPDADERRAGLLALSRDAHWLHLDHDPRITRLGRVLRRCSLDELPQLVNVLRGEMSLVGPRPLPTAEHVHLPPWSVARVEVRPGLTGLWQVMGRTRLSFLDMLRLDCEYVRELSWQTDLKILVRTIPAVLHGQGAK